MLTQEKFTDIHVFERRGYKLAFNGTNYSIAVLDEAAQQAIDFLLSQGQEWHRN